MKTKNRLAQAVRTLRQRLGLNQTDFAVKVGVSAMSVSRWEAGQNDPPAECIVNMAKLAHSLDEFWYFLRQVGLKKSDLAGRL